MTNNLVIATQRGMKFFRRINGYWEERDYSLTSVELTALDMVGDVGLAGSKDGVYITHDAGQSWIMDSKGILTKHIRWVRIHPEDQRYFYVGTEPANIYSKRISESAWHQSQEIPPLRDANKWFMPYSPNPGCVRGFAFHGSRLYAAVEVGGLLVSDDYGDHWELVSGSTGKPRQSPTEGQLHPDVHSVDTHQASQDLVFAPTGGGFYSSVDGGATWSLKYDCYCRAVWVDPENSNHLVLGPADGVSRGGRIEETTDGGETWHLIMDSIEERWQDTMVERFIASDGEIFAVLSNGKLLTAKTGDFSWQYLLPGINNAAILTLI